MQVFVVTKPLISERCSPISLKFEHEVSFNYGSFVSTFPVDRNFGSECIWNDFEKQNLGIKIVFVCGQTIVMVTKFNFFTNLVIPVSKMIGRI